MPTVKFSHYKPLLTLDDFAQPGAVWFKKSHGFFKPTYIANWGPGRSVEFTQKELAGMDARLPTVIERICQKGADVDRAMALSLTLQHWRKPGQAVLPSWYVNLTADSTAPLAGHILEINMLWREFEDDDHYEVSGSYVLVENVNGVEVALSTVALNFHLPESWVEQAYPGASEKVRLGEQLGLDAQTVAATIVAGEKTASNENLPQEMRYG